MKDFYGNKLQNRNLPLDYDNSVYVHNDTGNSTNVIKKYTPIKDGVFILECSYRGSSICDLSIVNRGRVASVAQANNVAGAENNACLIPAYGNVEYEVKGRNFALRYVPYM